MKFSLGKNVEVVVHMLKISCGSSVISSYYTTFLLVKNMEISFKIEIFSLFFNGLFSFDVIKIFYQNDFEGGKYES